MPRQLVASPWLVPGRGRPGWCQMEPTGASTAALAALKLSSPLPSLEVRSPPCLPRSANLAQAESRKIVRPCIVRISTAAMSARVRELAPITVSSRLGNAFQVATCSALP